MSIEFQTSLDGLDAADADMDFDPVRVHLLLIVYC